MSTIQTWPSPAATRTARADRSVRRRTGRGVDAMQPARAADDPRGAAPERDQVAGRDAVHRALRLGQRLCRTHGARGRIEASHRRRRDDVVGAGCPRPFRALETHTAPPPTARSTGAPPRRERPRGARAQVDAGERHVVAAERPDGGSPTATSDRRRADTGSGRRPGSSPGRLPRARRRRPLPPPAAPAAWTGRRSLPRRPLHRPRATAASADAARRRRRRWVGAARSRPGRSAVPPARAAAAPSAAPTSRAGAASRSAALSPPVAGAGRHSRRRAERGVVGEHRVLEGAQRRAGLESQLGDQAAAGIGVGVQRVRLTARAVEREHLLARRRSRSGWRAPARRVRRPARRGGRPRGRRRCAPRARPGGAPRAARRGPQRAARSRGRRAPVRARAPAPRGSARPRRALRTVGVESSRDAARRPRPSVTSAPSPSALRRAETRLWRLRTAVGGGGSPIP